MSRLEHIDPYNIAVSEFNERKEMDGTSELAKSVEKQGVTQPVLVRDRGDKEMQYEVVIGQRRVMAAQAADCNVVPAVVVQWDDSEALLKSITENIDAFQEDVNKKDRAKAIDRLKDMKNWTNQEVANRLGVARTTVTKWLEYTRDEWEGTSVDPKKSNDKPLAREQPESDADTLGEVRKMTGGGEEGEEVLEEVEEKSLNRDDVREVRKKVQEEDKEPKEAVQDVAEEKQDSGSINAEVKISLTGSKAEALQEAAKERATTEETIVEQAVNQFLEQEGYL